MNEIEQVVKSLDLLEQMRDMDDFANVTNDSLNEVFIYDTDVDNLKDFLTKALQQLNNLDITIKNEGDEE